MEMILTALFCLCEAVFLQALSRVRRRPAPVGETDRPGLFRFAQGEDDSDMKIAGAEPKPQEDEAARAAARLRQHKASGSAAAARRLGGALAARVMREDVSALCVGSAAGRVHLQCRMLLCCIVYRMIERRIADKVLDGLVTQAFNRTMEREYARFYEQMTSSGAPSFYALSLRGEDDPAPRVGETFARLTDREKDEAAERDGAALYTAFAAAVERAVVDSGLAG